MRLPGGDIAARLAERLHALDYSVEGVRRLLGPIAADALDRDQAIPARRDLRNDNSPLATVVKACMLGDVVAERALSIALGVEAITLHGLIDVSGDEARALIELSPCAVDDKNWYVAADWSSRRTGRSTASDHVLGVGGASTMLAQCAPRPHVSAALDIGTGCGIQAFHLSGHCSHVVATDVSTRCLSMARFNAALNGFELDLRQGSLYEPVVDEQFDLIVSNPPFVIGSPDASKRDYRDFGSVGERGSTGDAACARVVSGADAHLTNGGWCQILANWEITDTDDWSAAPRRWVGESSADVWVIQREVQDPAEYVETWLHDAGEQYDARYSELYDEWLRTLEQRGVLGVGFGVVTLHRSGRSHPLRRFQHAPQPWRQPVGAEIEQWFAVQDLVERDAAGVLLRPLSVGADVVLERHGWRSDQQVLIVRRTAGMGWSGPIDEFGAEVLGRLDGSQPVSQAVIDAANVHGIPVEEALANAVPVLGHLAEEGFVQGVL